MQRGVRTLRPAAFDPSGQQAFRAECQRLGSQNLTPTLCAGACGSHIRPNFPRSIETSGYWDPEVILHEYNGKKTRKNELFVPEATPTTGPEPTSLDLTEPTPSPAEIGSTAGCAPESLRSPPPGVPSSTVRGCTAPARSARSELTQDSFPPPSGWRFASGSKAVWSDLRNLLHQC